MNAIEHGNECRSEVPVRLRVTASDDALTVQVVDQGGADELPDRRDPRSRGEARRPPDAARAGVCT